jgi:acyl-CoA thioester hydrolase
MSSTPFIAETTFHVRYAETDAQSIVHHSSYVVYLEEGRSDYLRQRGTSYADFEREGYFLSVTEIQVRYIRPAKYDELLTVKTWITEARSRSLTFQYSIVNAKTGEEYVTGTSKHICVNRAGQVARIPSAWSQWVSS